MFERRLKIFLGVLLLITVALVLRAAQVQVVQRDEWRRQATETMKRAHFFEASRGRILDYRGNVVAEDRPCMDACVDYRAIRRVPDEAWVLESARRRLRERMGTGYTAAPRDKQLALRAEEIKRVKADIDGMWAKLASVARLPAAGGGTRPMTVDEMDELRRSIDSKVNMRRRFVWYRNYELAVQKHNSESDEPDSAWRHWLTDDSGDAPQLDSFEVTVAEQTEAHVVVRNIPPEAQNELGVYSHKYPGLVLRPSTHRYYPYDDAACHLLGHLTKVQRKDLKNDPNAGVNELRQYLPNDLIGRTGVEALCEPVLRGSRGRVEKVDGKDVSTRPAEQGRDVRLTIDVELQQEIQAMFKSVAMTSRLPEERGGGERTEEIEMHGSAVVIDVKSGEVRALASYPAYNLNRFDEDYGALHDDELNNPLMNRATQAQREPGSSVKPIVGLAAITAGRVGPVEGVECTGYLVVKGRTYGRGRCWVASKFHNILCHDRDQCRRLPCPAVAHHRIGGGVEHKGTHGNPDGSLTFSDALERSCNPYFERLAGEFGLDGLSDWYARFGLGRPVGLGIGEAKGRLPKSYEGKQKDFAAWSAGIGQGPVAATPVQMANVAATIARDGVWLRPTLVKDEAARPKFDTPDRVDLRLSPEGLKEAKFGMFKVVNSRSGTGTSLRREDVKIAGKTGTAQASRLREPLLNAEGRPVKDEKGRTRRGDFLTPSTAQNPNPKAPWYRGTGPGGTDLSHAWFIGFAPAENPQIAFAVLVEYGGSGGGAAAGGAKDVIQACIERGYLKRDPPSIEQEKAK